MRKTINKNEVKAIFDDSSCMILATDTGLIINGNKAELLSIITTMMRQLISKKVIDEKDLEMALKLTKMSNEELNEVMESQLKSLLKLKDLDKMLNKIFED